MPAGVSGFISFHIRWNTEYFTMTADHYFTSKGHYSLVNQLERSATSIGANIHEANYAHGKPDFIAKLQIALKECYETEYWLELFVKSDILNRDTVIDLYNQCGTVRRILIASINTAKENVK